MAKEHNIHKEVKMQSMRHMEGERARRAKGGRAEASDKNDKEYGGGDDIDEKDTETSYSGKSHVTEEAKGEEPFKKGGRAKKARGGKTEEKKEDKKEDRKKHVEMEGEKRRARLDRPARKRGGGVGADTNPLTTANHTTDRRGPSKGDDERGITGEA